MYKATLRLTTQNWWDKEPKVQMDTIARETEHELHAVIFREYFNRYKYCNSMQLAIIEPEVAAAYRVWVGDVNNYANNGGDMW